MSPLSANIESLYKWSLTSSAACITKNWITTETLSDLQTLLSQGDQYKMCVLY